MSYTDTITDHNLERGDTLSEKRREENGKASVSLGDASKIPQPDYSDLWRAYEAGAQSALKHPNVTTREIKRSADAFCKLVHSEKDPEGFAAIGS